MRSCTSALSSPYRGERESKRLCVCAPFGQRLCKSLVQEDAATPYREQARSELRLRASMSTDGTKKSRNPPPSVYIFGGREPEEALDSASKVRCAYSRLAFLVADGRIPVKRHNAVAFSIAGAAKAREIEYLEQISVAMAARQIAERYGIDASQFEWSRPAIEAAAGDEGA